MFEVTAMRRDGSTYTGIYRKRHDVFIDDAAGVWLDVWDDVIVTITRTKETTP